MREVETGKPLAVLGSVALRSAAAPPKRDSSRRCLIASSVSEVISNLMFKMMPSRDRPVAETRVGKMVQNHDRSTMEDHKAYTLARYHSARPDKVLLDTTAAEQLVTIPRLDQVVASAAEEARESVGALKAHLTRLFSGLPIQLQTQRRKFSTDIYEDISQLDCALLRIQKAAGSGNIKSLRGSNQIIKTKLKLQGSIHYRQSWEKSEVQLVPAILSTVGSLLTRVSEQGYVLSSDDILQDLKLRLASFKKIVTDEQSKFLLQNQMRAAEALRTTRCKVQVLKLWKLFLFPDVRGCRRKLMVALRARIRLRKIQQALRAWSDWISGNQNHRLRVASLQRRGLLVDLRGWLLMWRLHVRVRMLNRHLRDKSSAGNSVHLNPRLEKTVGSHGLRGFATSGGDVASFARAGGGGEGIQSARNLVRSLASQDSRGLASNMARALLVDDLNATSSKGSAINASMGLGLRSVLKTDAAGRGRPCEYCGSGGKSARLRGLYSTFELFQEPSLLRSLLENSHHIPTRFGGTVGWDDGPDRAAGTLSTVQSLSSSHASHVMQALERRPLHVVRKVKARALLFWHASVCLKRRRVRCQLRLAKRWNELLVEAGFDSWTKALAGIRRMRKLVRDQWLRSTRSCSEMAFWGWKACMRKGKIVKAKSVAVIGGQRQRCAAKLFSAWRGFSRAHGLAYKQLFRRRLGLCRFHDTTFSISILCGGQKLCQLRALFNAVIAEDTRVSVCLSVCLRVCLSAS